jgi:alpha-1,6-mannosyltransferase
LFLLVAAAAVRLGGSLAGSLAGLRLAALAGVALIALSVPALARRAGVDPARALWIVLASPLVLVHLVSGVHNDALMVGLLVAGLAVVGSGRPGALFAGGLLLGAAADVKATAAVVLPFAVLAAMPPRPPRQDSASFPQDSASPRQDSASFPQDSASPRQRQDGASFPQDSASPWRRGAEVLGGAVLASGGLSLLSGHGLGWVNGLLGSGDTVEWTSPSTAVGIVVSRIAGVDAVPATRLIGIVLLVPALAAIWWWARRNDALLGAGLALAATVLLAPVFHPWYAIWPLAALHRDLRRLTVPCAVAAVLCLPDGYNIALGTRIQGAVLMTAGIAAAVVVAVRRARVATLA